MLVPILRLIVLVEAVVIVLMPVLLLIPRLVVIPVVLPSEIGIRRHCGLGSELLNLVDIDKLVEFGLIGLLSRPKLAIVILASSVLLLPASVLVFFVLLPLFVLF